MRTLVARFRLPMALLFLHLTLCLSLPAQRLAADGAPQTFHVLTDQYFDQFFHFNPTAATADGFHQYDGQLEDDSPAGLAAEGAFLHAFDKKFAAIPASALDRDDAADLLILQNNIKSQLLTLEVIRNWQKNPDNYSSGITNSIFILMERNFAPANDRLKSVVAREQQVPKALADARVNLKNPPRIFTEIALEQIDDLATFFANDVPAAFNDATDPTTKAAFAKSNAATIQALKDYGAWMKSDLLPRSNGDFKLGADTFRKKLLYDEMVDIPLDHLLEVAYADLHKNQAEFARVAKLVDPTKTPQQVLAELASIHPAPDQLLDAFHQQFDQLITFIRAHHIVTIPSDVQPVLEETPPFMRATTQASMDPPGPYETHSTRAYFNVTLPEKDWTPEHIAEHMAAFNIGTIVSTSVHEAYPGHYIQFLNLPYIPSKVRKLTGASSNIEGWAHYCEQMMLDEGYASAPANATPDQIRTAHLIRLGQLQDALLRDARFIVSLKLHTGVGTPGSFSLDEARDVFVKEGYQSPSIGLMETKRGTADATYLYYTLGKLQIMKLREDLKAKQGAAFNLQQFHDEFLRQGPVPNKIIREALLHDNSSTL